jgi:lauroyl-KDO2-lipid IV(A) myristoyltransferase
MNKRESVGASALVYQVKFRAAFLSPAYWPTWFAVLLLFILMCLPALVTDGIACLLGDAARRLNGKRRNIATINLKLSFPQLDDAQRQRLLVQTFRAQMRSVLHYGLFWFAPRWLLKKRILIDGEQHIQNSLQAGRSVIVMASHSVGLEAAVSAITMRYPISGPFKVMRNEVINWLVARGRTRFGTIIYSREAGLRPIIRDVRAGQLMFYLPDEDLGKERSIFVPLFGVQKATIPVLGRLAKSCNADVLPCISCYDHRRRRYHIHLSPALDDFPQLDDDRDARIMNRAIEESIALCPAEYFWTLRLYRTRPEGESRFY